MRTDASPRLKLIVAQKSGDLRILSFSQSSDRQWNLDAKSSKAEGTENPLSRGVFVLKAGTGVSKSASRLAFRQAVYGDSEPALAKKTKDWDLDAHCFLLTAGEKGARCNVNITGSRAGRAEWGRDRKLETLQVVGRNGTYLLQDSYLSSLQ